MNLNPGQGIDFAALQQVLVIVLALYVLASVFGWLQALVLNRVVQDTVFRLREEVEAKINRLPLSYFDKMQRGELLSRVTNDIDNVSQSLQQTLSQLLTSLLTVIGVLVMMFVTSWLLAFVALVTIPLTFLITALIAKRSQKLFVAQWAHTGALNAQIEETFTGHALVKVFGRQREVESAFTAKNEQLYEASFGAQFVSGMIMPAMMFVGNLVYVAIAVIGGLQVAAGSIEYRRRAGVHPVLAPVHAAAHAARLDGQPAAVRRRERRARVRAAGCRRAEPRPVTGRDTGRRPRPPRVRGCRVQLRPGAPADHEPLADRRTRPDGRDRRTHRRRQDHARESHHAVLRAATAVASRSTASTSRP